VAVLLERRKKKGRDSIMQVREKKRKDIFQFHDQREKVGVARGQKWEEKRGEGKRQLYKILFTSDCRRMHGS